MDLLVTRDERWLNVQSGLRKGLSFSDRHGRVEWNIMSATRCDRGGLLVVVRVVLLLCLSCTEKVQREAVRPLFGVAKGATTNYGWKGVRPEVRLQGGAQSTKVNTIQKFTHELETVVTELGRASEAEPKVLKIKVTTVPN